VTFDIKGTIKDAKHLLDHLELCYIGPSLGGCETLITHPALVSYYDYSRKDRYKLGITDTLFRLAVGIENAEGIIADLDHALRK
jgi:cystathionine gamma-synthase